MKKILLVVDQPNWAFDIVAKAIQRHLPEYDIQITYDITLHGVPTKKYDYVHYMSWLDGARWASQVSAGVCSHNWHLKWKKRAKEKMPKFKRLVCISKTLEEQLQGMNKNITYIPNGVNVELFRPMGSVIECVEIPLGIEYKKLLKVGFVGQKTSGGFGKGRNNEGIKMWDIKGYNLVLKPLMERLKGKVEFKILTNDYTNAIPHEKMPEWFSDIDVLICTSLYEGCPLPVLEAAACGKTVISTRVGIVPELIKHDYNGFIIDAPRSEKDLPDTIRAFETYIAILKSDRGRCYQMGSRNREVIEESWSWEKIAPRWKDFFES